MAIALNLMPSSQLSGEGFLHPEIPQCPSIIGLGANAPLAKHLQTIKQFAPAYASPIYNYTTTISQPPIPLSSHRYTFLYDSGPENSNIWWPNTVKREDWKWGIGTSDYPLSQARTRCEGSGDMV